jgi:hypothetical protein
MARSGITKAQVRAVRDRLVADGQHPSADAVRHGLGNVGSKSTIHRFLTELRDEEAAPGMPLAETTGALSALVEQLAARLHADAEARVQALQAEHRRALAAKECELAVLRERIDELEAAATPPRWQSQRRTLDDGFGSFDSMLLNSRSAARDSSPFDLARTAARSS